MAKSPRPAAGPLAGRAVTFVGKFGYGDGPLARYRALAKAAGARVVEPDRGGTLDCVVVGEGRGGKPPADAARLARAYPALQTFDVPAFCTLVMPGRAELLAELAGGRLDYTRWDELDDLFRAAGTGPDLSRADLRGLDLYGAKLDHAGLDGADFRGAKLQYTHLPTTLRDTRFDGATAEHLYLGNVDRCSFRKANLGEAWFFFGPARTATGCDFTGAKLAAARAVGGTFTDCKFVGADLSDIQAERTVFDRADFSKADLSRLHAPGAKFARAVFARAKLGRADLRNATLVGADLRNADLRDAALGGADLTDALVAGADFAGAVLTGATLTGVDVTKAKNLTIPAARVPGPMALELAAAAAGSTSFVTTAEVDLGPDEFASLELSASGRSGSMQAGGYSRCFRGRSDTFDHISGITVEDVLLNLAERWPNATLRLDSVTAKGSKTLRGAKLLALAQAAWAEAFSVAAGAETLEQQRERQKAEAVARRDALFADTSTRGAAVWNDLGYHEQERYDLTGLNASGAKLAGIELNGRRDLKMAKFTGADLTGAELLSSAFQSADFAGANLTRAEFGDAHCENASFRGAVLVGADLTSIKLNGADLRDADLTGAKLDRADLRGADLTGAKLAKATLDAVKHDKATKWPARFAPPGGKAGAAPKPVVAGSVDFPTFVKNLAEQVEPGRMANATAMLKAEKFQLFAEVTDAAVTGVVKSQSSAGRVYACRLAAGGEFGCGTQNLRPCGGLGGKACKHILVLVVGLAKAGRLDPAAAAAWLDASRAGSPEFDKDAMGDVFLRYKGAEAGEVDWRPTETLPEDFYAL